MATGKELKLAISIAGRLDKSLGVAVNQAQAQLNSIHKSANKYATAAEIAITGATVKLVKDSIKTYSEYEDAVNSAAAVFDVRKGTAQFEAIEKAARDVGLTTVKSAKEGANALEYMALAGWSVEKSTKALIPVVKLSASTGMDLATTSDLVTDTMAALGIGIDDVDHYLDVMAKANNSANYTSQMLLESLTNVGGVYRALNVGVEDGAAVLGVLANQGTKGSEAGTNLNTVLTRMQKQSGEAAKGMAQLGLSMFDAQGNTRNIIDVFEDMYNATKDMTDEQRNQAFTLIGGTRGYRALTKIMSGFKDTTAEGVPIIRALAAAYRDADGALDNFYDIKTDTIKGAATRLQRLYEDMQISIGEALAPQLNDLIEHLAEKMPDIENVIVSTIENAAPYVTRFLDFVINNLDKIIDGAFKFVKIFAGIKIGSGVLRGLTNFTTLLTNLGKLGAARGIGTVLKGIIGTFTGITTAAGTAGGAVTGFLATIAPFAAVAGGVIALDVVFDRLSNYSRGMNKTADAIGEATTSLIKYNDIAQQVADLREIIKNPESSTAQIEAARTKLQEIADMLGEKYNLTINADTTQLENAINMAQQASRGDLISSGRNFLGKAQKGAGKYAKDTRNISEWEKEANALSQLESNYSSLRADYELYEQSYRNGFDTQEQYLANMNKLYNKAKDMGVEFEYIGDTVEDFDIQRLIDTIDAGLDDARFKLNDTNDDLETARKNVEEYAEATQKASDYLTQALASDVKSGNAYGADTDIQMINELAAAMVTAGMSTDDLAMKFVVAKEGFTELDEAIGEGGVNAQQLAQNYIDFKLSIGEAAENAVQGAALIANGFTTTAAAVAAGDEAVNNVIADLMRIGEVQGVFDGLDSTGVAAKLTEMAQAMELIPDTKEISIDAEGNLSVIETAENALANMSDSANVTIDATDNATEKAEAVNDKISELDAAAANPDINANDNATAIINSVASKLDDLDGKTATTTIVTKYETKGKKPGESATGAYSWGGGLTYVNDQNISDPREVIEYGNMRWWYEGRDVLADVPRGARIYTAAQSKQFINGSHENGLQRVPFDGYIAELHEGERVLTSDEADNYNRIDFNSMLALLEEMIISRRGGGGGNTDGDNGGGGGDFVYSPKIIIQGNADEQTMTRVIQMSQREFREMYEEMKRDERRKRF